MTESASKNKGVPYNAAHSYATLARASRQASFNDTNAPVTTRSSDFPLCRLLSASFSISAIR